MFHALISILMAGTQDELFDRCRAFAEAQSYECVYERSPLEERGGKLVERSPDASMTVRYDREHGVEIEQPGCDAYRQGKKLVVQDSAGKWEPFDFFAWWALDAAGSRTTRKSKADQRLARQGEAYSFVLPHEILADGEHVVAGAESSTDGSVTTYRGALTPTGAERFAGRFYEHGLQADMMSKADGKVDLSGTIAIQATGASIERIEVDIRATGTLLKRDLEEQFRQVFEIRKWNEVEVSIPRAAARAMDGK